MRDGVVSCAVCDATCFLSQAEIKIMQKTILEACTCKSSQWMQHGDDVFVVYLSQHHPTSPTFLYLPQWKSDQWMSCWLPVSKNTFPLNSWSVSPCVLVVNTSSVSWLTLVYCFNFRMLPLQLKAFSRCFHADRFPMCESLAVLCLCQGRFHRTWVRKETQSMPDCHMCSAAWWQSCRHVKCRK